MDVREIANFVQRVDLVDITFLLKNKLNTRDVSNLVKAAEDAIAKIIEIDDSKTMEFRARKAQSPTDYEALLVTVKLTLKSNVGDGAVAVS